MQKECGIVEIIFLLLFFGTGLITIVSAVDNEIDLINHTTKTTIINETGCKTEETFLFQSNQNYNLHYHINLSLPWYYTRGDSKIYGTSGNDWQIIPKDSTGIDIGRDFSPYETFQIQVYRFVPNLLEKKNNSYRYQFEGATAISPVHNLEVKIPAYLGINKFKLLSYGTPPVFEGYSSNYYIMRWEFYASPISGISSGLTYITYTYEFSWG